MRSQNKLSLLAFAFAGLFVACGGPIDDSSAETEETGDELVMSASLKYLMRTVTVTAGPVGGTIRSYSPGGGGNSLRCEANTTCTMYFWPGDAVNFMSDARAGTRLPWTNGTNITCRGLSTYLYEFGPAATYASCESPGYYWDSASGTWQGGARSNITISYGWLLTRF